MFRSLGIASPGGVAALVHRAVIVALLARRAIHLAALGRVAPQAAATVALSPAEITLIDRMVGGEAIALLSDALAKLGRLGAVSPAARRSWQPLAVAHGLSRVADLQIAARLRAAKYRERT